MKMFIDYCSCCYQSVSLICSLWSCCCTWWSWNCNYIGGATKMFQIVDKFISNSTAKHIITSHNNVFWSTLLVCCSLLWEVYNFNQRTFVLIINVWLVKDYFVTFVLILSNITRESEGQEAFRASPWQLVMSPLDISNPLPTSEYLKGIKLFHC